MSGYPLDTVIWKGRKGWIRAAILPTPVNIYRSQPVGQDGGHTEEQYISATIPLRSTF